VVTITSAPSTTFRYDVVLAPDPGHLMFTAGDIIAIQDSPGLHSAAMTVMLFMHNLNMR